jgi:hypothetical protein
VSVVVRDPDVVLRTVDGFVHPDLCDVLFLQGKAFVQTPE